VRGGEHARGRDERAGAEGAAAVREGSDRGQVGERGPADDLVALAVHAVAFDRFAFERAATEQAGLVEARAARESEKHGEREVGSRRREESRHEFLRTPDGAHPHGAASSASSSAPSTSQFQVGEGSALIARLVRNERTERSRNS